MGVVLVGPELCCPSSGTCPVAPRGLNAARMLYSSIPERFLAQPVCPAWEPGWRRKLTLEERLAMDELARDGPSPAPTAASMPVMCRALGVASGLDDGVVDFGGGGLWAWQWLAATEVQSGGLKCGPVPAIDQSAREYVICDLCGTKLLDTRLRPHDEQNTVEESLYRAWAMEGSPWLLEFGYFSPSEQREKFCGVTIVPELDAPSNYVAAARGVVRLFVDGAVVPDMTVWQIVCPECAVTESEVLGQRLTCVSAHVCL